jgi:hypothetical protein
MILTMTAVGYSLYEVHPMLLAAYSIFCISSLIEAVLTAYENYQDSLKEAKKLQDLYDKYEKDTKWNDKK